MDFGQLQNCLGWSSLAKIFLNTFMLVTVILIGQFFVTTLAGFAFAQIKFPGRDFVFILVLMQLFILPEVLIVENYAMVSRLGLFDTILGVGMPYMFSFWNFLMRQAFKGVPYELHEAVWYFMACYVPLAPYCLCLGFSINSLEFFMAVNSNNTPDTRPLTVGLSDAG